jgi:hypothetical protein
MKKSPKAPGILRKVIDRVKKLWRKPPPRIRWLDDRRAE